VLLVQKKAITLWCAIWLVLLAAAFAADYPVVTWLVEHRFHDESAHIVKYTRLADGIKLLGEYPTVMVIAAVLVVIRRLSWQRGGALLLCAATALLAELTKWVSGRPRPLKDDGTLCGTWEFAPFTQHSAGNAFVSGHVMLAFATAACLTRYYPRLWPVFYGLACLVALERVLEIAHHVSDVVAAAGLGIACSLGCMALLRRWATPSDARAAEVLEGVET